MRGRDCICVFVHHIAVSVYVGAHTVRYRLRKWQDRELAGLGEDTRYAEGYRDALLNLAATIKRRRFKIHMGTEGEI